MMWDCAPLSDQDWKVYKCGPFCPGGALIEFFDPTITVRLKEVGVAAPPPNTRGIPPGVVWKVSKVVCGFRRKVWVLASPPESVAVRVSCR